MAFRRLFLWSLLPLVAACAHRGAAFSLVPAENPDRAVVYLFRPASMAGSARSPDVFVDDKKVLELANGGYGRLELAPGRRELRIETSPTFNYGTAYLEVEPGKEYFVKYEIEPELKIREALVNAGALGLVGGAIALPDQEQPLILRVLPREEGLAEIRETMRIEPEP
jgi:hypothetical protein